MASCFYTASQGGPFYLARPERFELPTAWFVAFSSQPCSRMSASYPSGHSNVVQIRILMGS